MNHIGRILLLLSLAIGPLCLGSYYGPYRWPLLITVTCAIVILVAFPRDKNTRQAQKHKHTEYRPHFWLLGLIALLVVQGIWMWYNAWGEFQLQPWHIYELENQPAPHLPGSADRNEAWDRLSYLFPCLGLVWVTRQTVIQRPEFMGEVAATLFWTGVAVASLGLLQQWTEAEGIFWMESFKFHGRSLFFGTYRSPGIASAYLNLSLAMGLSCMLGALQKSSGNRTQWSEQNAEYQKKPTVVWAILRVLGVVVIFSAVMSAGSKAGMAFGILTLLVWSLMNRKAIMRALSGSVNLFSGNRRLERNILIGLLAVISVLGVLSVAGTTWVRWQSAQEGDFSTLSGRGAANAIQFEMLQDSEWGALGYGPGSFYPLFHYYAKGELGYGVHVYAHNDFLQTLIEWGWLGGAAMALLVFGAVFFLIRELFFYKDRHGKSRIFYFRSALIAMLVMLLHANVDFPFQIESIAVTFAVLMGLGWASRDLRRLSKE